MCSTSANVKVIGRRLREIKFRLVSDFPRVMPHSFSKNSVSILFHSWDSVLNRSARADGQGHRSGRRLALRFTVFAYVGIVRVDIGVKFDPMDISG